LTDVFVWTRAVHYVAMLSMAGGVFFAAFVAEPAFRRANYDGGVASVFRSRLAKIIWASLLAGAGSAVIWLVLLAARLADVPVLSALSGGPLWMVLSDTDFGQIWALRLVLMAAFASALLLSGYTRSFHRSWRVRVASIVFAAALVGTLAWAGHAAANVGTDLKGSAHFAGDVLHLVAGAAWVGSLVPLAMLLGIQWAGVESLPTVVKAATVRFSTLGMLSVGTILVSGLNNTWVLARSIHALTSTDYGQLLLLKVMLFLMMLGIATVNRFRLTPRLVDDKNVYTVAAAAHQLRRNALIEACLGGLILIIVAALGTMTPGSEGMVMEIPE
jgi:copper resistance protein D